MKFTVHTSTYNRNRRYRLIYRYEDCPYYRTKCTNANYRQLIQEIADIIDLGVVDFMVHLQNIEGEFASYAVACNFDYPTSYDEYLGNV